MVDGVCWVKFVGSSLLGQVCRVFVGSSLLGVCWVKFVGCLLGQVCRVFVGCLLGQVLLGGGN